MTLVYMWGLLFLYPAEVEIQVRLYYLKSSLISITNLIETYHLWSYEFHGMLNDANRTGYNLPFKLVDKMQQTEVLQMFMHMIKEDVVTCLWGGRETSPRIMSRCKFLVV